MDHEQAIAEYTELMRRLSGGADEERSASPGETGTSPVDGVEESLAHLERLAAKEGLHFVWRERSQRYALEPLPLDTHHDEQTGTPHTRLVEAQRQKKEMARKARSTETDESEDSQPQEEVHRKSLEVVKEELTEFYDERSQQEL